MIEILFSPMIFTDFTASNGAYSAASFRCRCFVLRRLTGERKKICVDRFAFLCCFSVVSNLWSFIFALRIAER